MKKSANTIRLCDWKLQLIAKRKLLIRRTTISLFAATIMTGWGVISEAQQISKNPRGEKNNSRGIQEDILGRADIETSYSDLRKLINELIGASASAEDSLRTVKEMKLEGKRNEVVNQMFEDMKVKVNKTLNGLSPNSTFMDNLEGAKANMIVLKRWFERQPTNYPRRDHLIMRIDEVIRGYDESAGAIQSGRKEAQDALRELVRTQFLTSMEQKVETAEDSVDMTKRLVTSLEAVSKKLGELAKLKKEIPAISN